MMVFRYLCLRSPTVKWYLILEVVSGNQAQWSEWAVGVENVNKMIKHKSGVKKQRNHQHLSSHLKEWLANNEKWKANTGSYGKAEVLLSLAAKKCFAFAGGYYRMEGYQAGVANIFSKHDTS